MKRFSVRELTLTAAVAAIYVVLGYFGNIFSLNFGVVQCRIAEALTVLPFLNPLAAVGLFVGCVITNILSPYGPLDMIFGSLATLTAGLLTARCRNKWLAPLPPVVLNAVIIGGMIAFQEVGLTAAFATAFAYHALTIGAGQVLACYMMGIPLLAVMQRVKLFRTGR